MTLEQILSNSNKTGDLTKSILFKSLKLQVESLFTDITKNFATEIARTVSDIASGDPCKLGYYPCYPEEPNRVKIMLSDETKQEVLNSFEKIVKADVAKYKNDINLLFAKEVKEEPKQEVEITIEKPAAPIVNSLFGY